MRVLAYSLMPNHFHLVLFPNHDSDLSRWGKRGKRGTFCFF